MKQSLVRAYALKSWFSIVLNSRKHYKVAQQLLLQRFPGTSIIGVFLARCLPDPPLEFEPLPDVD